MSNQIAVQPRLKPAIETALKRSAEVDASAGVVTTRGHVEYRGVDLHGRSFHERAAFLVSVAHPDFRSGLRLRVHQVQHFVV